MGVGLSGLGFLLFNLQGWFGALKPPAMLPPPWVFPPAAVLMYLCAGLAAWQIWRAPNVAWRNHRALRIWGWQMALKALWVPVFFALHWLAGAFLLGTVLAGLSLTTFRRFAEFNREAGWLMLPFLGWVGFELYLAAGFWWLNA